MLIIDEEADVKLCKLLEQMRSKPISARCIYLALNTQAESIRDAVATAARTHIGETDLSIYYGEDGDVVLMAPTIHRKGGQDCIAEIARNVQEPLAEGWAQLFELPLHLNPLLVKLEPKLKQRQDLKEEEKSHIKLQALERQRRAILTGALPANAESIAQRRASHAQPELMLIEDDPFTRRLVDNVLSKQYRLTALGEASTAIDTYVRLAPDILFLDINLPNVTGHELLERIVEIDPAAYVIMLSGNADRDNITQAMSKGAKGFVAKPFTREKIIQYIEKCPTIRHDSSRVTS